jgi:3-dehydroquinate dehydratase-2
VRIAVLNGPNLNLLGTREPEIYGRTTLPQVEARLAVVARELDVDVECSQANGEGALVDLVHGFRGRADGVIVNGGAYSHTSLALRDALVGVSLPFVEVHVTNVYAREPERHHSMLASAAVGVIVGLGTDGYELALRGLVGALRARSAAR